jgi:calcineurin-like phosphoesterase
MYSVCECVWLSIRSTKGADSMSEELTTINLHILPGGTSLVADVGMTGPSGNPGGFPLQHFAARMRGEDPGSLPPFELATGPVTLGAVWLRIERGKTLEIERIS